MGRDLKIEEGGDLPWGIRVASGFLDFLAILVVIPTGLSALMAFSTLSVARVPRGELLFAFAYCGGMLGLFIVLLLTVLGSSWLAKYLRANHRSGGSYVHLWKSPLVVLGEPVLLTLIIYSILAVLTWCFAKIVEGSGSPIWLMVWTLVGAACMMARKRLNGDGIDPGVE